MKKRVLKQLLWTILICGTGMLFYFALLFGMTYLRALAAAAAGAEAVNPGGFEITLGTVPLHVVAVLSFCFIEIIVHECGHLLFGRLGGCSFHYIGILNVGFFRDSRGKLRFFKKRPSWAVGFISMALPSGDPKRKKWAHFLLSFGGVTFDLLLYLLASVVYVFSFRSAAVSYFSDLIACISFLAFYLNAFPFGKHPYENDVRKYLRLKKDPAEADRIELFKKAELLALEGVPFSEMPAELFPDIPVRSKMTPAELALCNLRVYRLLDGEDFAEAEALLDALLDAPAVCLDDFLKKEFLLERLTVALFRRPMREERIKELLSNDELKKELSSRRNYTALRTSYILALLYEKNAKKAEELAHAFELSARGPLRSVISCERKLMSLAGGYAAADAQKNADPGDEP